MHAVSRDFRPHTESSSRTGVFQTNRGLDAPARRRAGTVNRGRHPGPIQGLYTTGRTPCGDKPERTMPSRSPFGARMQWPEPAYTEQSLARRARPTKGGAVRIRIALGTAVAVIAIPAIFFAFFSSTSAASARLSRHEASEPAPGGEDQRHADVVRRGRERLQNGDVRQCRGSRKGADVPLRDRLPEDSRAT